MSHPELDADYKRITDDNAVTCPKCKSILSGQFDGKAFKLPK